MKVNTSSGRRLRGLVAIQPEDVERRRHARAHRLAVDEIPLLRAVGSAFISFGVFLDNRYLLDEPSLVPWLAITCVLAGYCIVSAVVLRLFYERVLPYDLSLFFLIVDVPVWTLAIYASGAERSWIFFILLIRVADQTQSTFRRCLGFVALGTVCYGAMLLWVGLVDDRPIALLSALVRVIFVAVSGVYIALVARTAESRRGQMADSLRIARELIRHQEKQSEELAMARRNAEEASEAKSEFLANMSHEMRTPLHGILGMLQLVRDGERSQQRIRQLDLARRSAEALLGTIDDILDFSKIEARRIDLEPVYFSLRDQMTDTMKALAVTAAAKGLDLAYLVEGDVPDSLWGDPLRLRQILVNLIGNSIKFTPAGGEVAVHVSHPPSSDDGRVTLRFFVRDTGIGIDPSKKSMIFEPFAQADSTHSRDYGGSGLGLSIVSRLVEAMGGAVTVTSRVGEGSAFSFTVKVDCDAVLAKPGREEWESRLAGVEVLVADAGEHSREFLAKTLRTRGMLVDTSASLTAAPRRDYACVVTGEVGVSFAPVIRVVSPLVTPHEDRLQITRPVSERELIDAVGMALGLVEEADTTIPPPSDLLTSDRRLRVLVAEDHPVSQEFAAEALRRLGHEVAVASDGYEVLGKVGTGAFDLVLMDVQMPGIDGLEVTRRLRAAGVRTPILAVTAHTRREDRDHCLEAGMTAVLTKPVDARQLAEAIEMFSGAQSDPIIDAVNGNLTLLARVSDAFAKQTPALMEAIRDAIEDEQEEALYQAAHKLRGSVSNFPGLPALELALQLERAARVSEFERAAEILPRLEDAMRDLEQRLSVALR